MFSYIFGCISLITSPYEDKFEIQFSIVEIANLVFSPTWLLKINCVIDSLEKVLLQSHRTLW